MNNTLILDCLFLPDLSMFILTKLLTALVLPPFSILILWLLALLCRSLKWKKISLFCTLFGILLLYISSISYTSRKLENSLIIPNRFSLQEYKNAQAIVLLGAGIRDSQELFSKISVTELGLERMRYAAYLQKETQLPLLITGSAYNGTSEADAMAKELAYFFNTPTTWIENKATTTKENALFSQAILVNQQIKKIILITQQWHMPRAKYLFEQAGFEVIPASVGYGIVPEHYALHFMHFIPQAGALHKNTLLLKEWLGLWKEKMAN